MCIGLNCEPWIRGGGGEQRKEEKRGELGYVNSIYSSSPTVHYCGMVHENVQSD